MTDYIPLSTLNDFIFCPYSIYLHNVYMEAAEDVYKARPQTAGSEAHRGIDQKSGSTRRCDLMAMPVYCDELGIAGKIDLFKQDRQLLIERKNRLPAIFRGQLYQLWGQYFCLKEMGYNVNQKALLVKTRCKDACTAEAINACEAALHTLPDITDYSQLMGLEGALAKVYFTAYFQHLPWHGRHARTKCDAMNVTLDIGYTILFNFMECNLHLFGFDLYIGVYHRLWFKRKSLVCDLVEPFRCIIDHTVLLAFNRKQFSEKDFTLTKNEYRLKHEKCADYYKVFFDALVKRKTEIFQYVQQFYRCFMAQKPATSYPLYTFT